MKLFSKFAIALLILMVFPMSTVRAAAFTDVFSDHPYFNAINYLHDQGVVEGYSDNTFKPEREVNRAEALKIILLSSDIFVPDAVDQFIFPDVTYDAWYGKYALKAKNLRIVQGDGDTGYFRPGDTINLAEILKILIVANDLKLPTVERNPYWDVPTDAWFAPYFEYARLANWIDGGSDQNVNPSGPVTRGLMAELMYRMATNDVVISDGEASYYGEKFHGRTTASGEIFDASAMTAAHRTYPFGTYLRVTNVENGESVIVKVNDRGPYADGRIIDLSKAAFEAISPLSRGVIQVAIEEVDPSLASQPTAQNTTLATTTPSNYLNANRRSCDEASSLQMIGVDQFDHITLDQALPNRLTTEEVLTISGSVSNGATGLKVFIADADLRQTHFNTAVTDGRFSIDVFFPGTGTYQLGVLTSKESSAPIKEVKVVDRRCIGEAEDSSLPKVDSIQTRVSQGNLVINWNDANQNLAKITFAQNDLFKSYIVRNGDGFSPYYQDFADFKEGAVQVEIRLGNSTQRSLLEVDPMRWGTAYRTTLTATTHHEYRVKTESVELLTLTEQVARNTPIRATFKTSVNLQPQAAFILPSGEVSEMEITGTPELTQNSRGAEVVPPSSQTLRAQITAAVAGTYFVEINNEDGLGVINVPVYEQGVYPLLPNPRDLSDGYTVEMSNNLALVRNDFLALVNADRARYGRTTLLLDDDLTRLAQHRSDDMAQNNYISHWDLDGNTANDLRRNFGIVPSVGENLASDVNVQLAEYGLMRSAVHRRNILSTSWTRVGLGISKNQNGTYSFVQIFSSDAVDLSKIDSLRSDVLSRINNARSGTLTTTDTLNTIAQDWSNRMTTEDFFDTIAPDGTNLAQQVRDAGINNAISTYIVGHSDFDAAVEFLLSNNEQLFESRWQRIGIGIRQDDVGFVVITTVYID